MDGDEAVILCFACANYQRLVFRKAADDLAKLASRPNGTPTQFTLVCGGKASARTKSKTVMEARRRGIRDAEVRTGTESDERIRRRARAGARVASLVATVEQ